ncbi:uncharacterized protein LOC120333770 [Styela clava]
MANAFNDNYSTSKAESDNFFECDDVIEIFEDALQDNRSGVPYEIKKKRESQKSNSCENRCNENQEIAEKRSENELSCKRMVILPKTGSKITEIAAALDLTQENATTIQPTVLNRAFNASLYPVEPPSERAFITQRVALKGSLASQNDNNNSSNASYIDDGNKKKFTDDCNGRNNKAYTEEKFETLLKSHGSLDETEFRKNVDQTSIGIEKDKTNVTSIKSHGIHEITNENKSQENDTTENGVQPLGEITDDSTTPDYKIGNDSQTLAPGTHPEKSLKLKSKDLCNTRSNKQTPSVLGYSNSVGKLRKQCRANVTLYNNWNFRSHFYVNLIVFVLLLALNPIPYKKDFKNPFLSPVNVNQYKIYRGKKRIRLKKISTKKCPAPPDVLENGTCIYSDGHIIEEQAETVNEGGHIELMQPPRKDGSGERGHHYKYQPNDVEADGKISDIASDPPGQQSVYIPPGDTRKEVYRLSTFENFPSSPAEPSVLARHGFFYTGFYDRVKCFSCARTVQEWRNADDARDRKWHNPSCDFANGRRTDNIPTGGGFTSFLSNSGMLPGNSSQDMDVPERQAATSVKEVRYPGGNVASGSGGAYQFGPGTTIHIGGRSATASNPSSGRLNASQTRGNPPTPREWRMANVISSDHRRMLTNLFLVRELDRLASFGRWSIARPNVSPAALARAGFFYLGDMDRTQCFSCGGVLRNWTIEDDAFDEHRSHFPNCRFVLGTDDRNVPIPEVDETAEERNTQYPCRFPSNPHMRAGREETFDRRWPRGRVQATPEQISEAGFFFLGERDRVKCWYCNGGLQNWEYDDIPWVEHSKWFPTCQFLLKTKGVRYVYRHLSQAAHFPRPIIARQDGGQIGAQAMDIPPAIGGGRVQAPSPPPEIVDPQEEMRKRKEKVDRVLQNSENVKTVIAMGYEPETVRLVLEEAAVNSSHEEIFDGMMPLLDEVMKREEEIKKQKEEEEVMRRTQEIRQLQQQIQPPSYQSVSSNYSMPSNLTSMVTTPSISSAVYNVSGFGDSDDENQDLYGSIAEAAGATGGQPQPINVTQPSTSTFSIPEDQESMKEILEKKQEEKMCKICFTNDADMVFVPCSHMVCCRTCTEAIRQCPVCRKKIEKAIRTYLN